ncbi:cytochrome c-type biogenesis protein CcmF [Rickettsiella massiliensis]|uniref:cytochrome c-type biogenesis protein CcmF n=1 Tax=Rickettsiella massiliensis TaxID=676517 RepID=UPI00029AC376|nr:cytochrome c-type biogenesis protein CcmF [Rickettsiella massiliensis]
MLASSQCGLLFCRPLPTLGLARCLSSLQHTLVIFLFFSLMWAFARNDFSLAYVAENSNRYLPLFYRLCAVWGGHEGSILLWVVILTL